MEKLLVQTTTNMSSQSRLESGEFLFVALTHSCSIHDHTDAHCFVKILEGNLQETKYEWPVGEEDHPLLVKEKTLFKTNEVSYMSGWFFLISR